jgi:hypothetical protein
MGVRTDATANDDFRAVRTMKTWPELEAKLAAVASGASPAPPEAPPSPPPAARAARSKGPASNTPRPVTTAAPDTIPFETTPFSPVGLAYDDVSRRFLVGDRAADRLMVIDEDSHHVVNLVHAAAAGFREDLTAFDIDHRRGDLWVVSASGDGEGAVSTVHKLQLVSGRSLLDIHPEGFGPVRFVDVAAAPDGAIWLLDSVGSRLFRIHAGSRVLDVAAKLDVSGASALALSDHDTAYIAGESGVLRVDLASRSAVRVKAPKPARRFVALRWHHGSLIAIEEQPTHARLLRLRLDTSGTTVIGTAVIADDLPAQTAVTIAGDTFYYLAGPNEIKAIHLK